MRFVDDLPVRRSDAPVNISVDNKPDEGHANFASSSPRQAHRGRSRMGVRTEVGNAPGELVEILRYHKRAFCGLFSRGSDEVVSERLCGACVTVSSSTCD